VDEAMNSLKSHDFSIVITDLYLPDGDGLELCKTIRGNDRKIGILVLTASDHLTTQMVEAAGAQAFLQKHEPGFVQKLVSEVKRLSSAFAIAA
jgi:CheY-like chemotaxis protein